MPTIKEEMRALDTRNFEWYQNLSEDEQKSLSMWVLMLYASSVESKVSEINHHYLTMVNDFVNVNFNSLKHHPELQWRLMQLCSVGTVQYHPWIRPGRRQSKASNRLMFEFYLNLYPHLKDDEIEMALALLSKEEKIDLLEQYGIEKKKIKDYLK